MNILAEAFPLSWSHYVLLISRSRSDEARQFYHAEALRGGWSVRQLQRQIDSQFMSAWPCQGQGRQKRLRIGTEWYRVDLVFFHRRLCCLMLIDLKLGRFTHADAGQMHLYLNYAREHWTHADENPPVGLILCSYKESAVVKYAWKDWPARFWQQNTAQYFRMKAVWQRRLRKPGGYWMRGRNEK